MLMFIRAMQPVRRFRPMALMLGLLLVAVPGSGLSLRPNPAAAARLPEDVLEPAEPQPMLEELEALRVEMVGAANRLAGGAARGRFLQAIPAPALADFLLARAYNGHGPADSVAAATLIEGFGRTAVARYLSEGTSDSLGAPFGAALHPCGASPAIAGDGATHLDDEAQLLALFARPTGMTKGTLTRFVATRLAADLASWIPGPDGTFMTSRTRPARAKDVQSIVRGPARDWSVARLVGALGLAAAVHDTADWAALGAIDVPHDRLGLWQADGDPLKPAFKELQSGALGYALDAYIDAYVATGRKSWQVAAAQAVAELQRQAAEGLLRWPTPYRDATGWAALGLTRWGTLAHDDSALATGRALLERMDLMHPPGAGASSARLASRAAAAVAVELQTHPAPMAYMIGDGGSAELERFRVAALTARRPLRLISAHDRNEADLLYPAGAEGKVLVYVCSGEACAAPVQTIPEMLALLESFARPEAPATLSR